jgi:hypothetical protein
MDSGVEFVAVDNRRANKLTIHILAAVADTSEKRFPNAPKAALAAAKTRGTIGCNAESRRRRAAHACGA